MHILPTIIKIKLGQKAEECPLDHLIFRGWLEGSVGITISQYNPHELKIARAHAKQVGARPFRQLLWDAPYDGLHGIIGGYQLMVASIFFDSVDMRTEFINLFADIPPRTKSIIVPDRAALIRILPYIRGTNYRMVEGRNAIALGITDEVSEDNLVLIRLAI